MAAANGHLPVILFLLGKVDIKNAQNAMGDTPLHWGAVNNHLEVVKALVDVEVDCKIKNERGKQAFDEAFMYGYSEICELLAPLTDMTGEEEFIAPEEELKEISDAVQPEEEEKEGKVNEISKEQEDIKEEVDAAEIET